jgi:TPR repeat protein
MTTELGLKERAHSAFLRGDYVAAREMYESLAALGNRGALLGLAAIFERGGSDLPQDYEKARYWYEMALSKGNSARAALQLGHFYCLGLGVPVDHEKAFHYYSKLENHAEPIGLLRLGLAYETGKGVVQDIDRARKLYRRASKLGSIRAKAFWGAWERKHGSFLFGIFLGLWSVVQAFPVAFKDPQSKRLRLF